MPAPDPSTRFPLRTDAADRIARHATRAAVALLVVGVAGCGARARPCPVRAPLPESRGEVVVLLEAFSPGARRLSLSAPSIAVVDEAGRETPLTVELTHVRGGEMTYARRWARGQLPPGRYTGLTIRTAKASLAQERGTADLLVPEAPTAIAAPFQIRRGRAALLSVGLDYPRSIRDGFAFTPIFEASPVPSEIPQMVGYASDGAGHSLSVFDPHTRRLVGVIPTGPGPRGIAVDAVRGHAYVGLSGIDAIEVLDVASSERLQRIQLQPGDEPGELALTPDGRTLITANTGSNTVSFVDPDAGVELARTAVGEEPSSVLVDREGKRAYVFNRRSNEITLLDIANRAAIRTIATEPEPVRGRLDRDGARLFAIHAGSPHMVVYSLPELEETGRVYVGLGMTALELDPNTDLIYIGMAGSDELKVYDPLSLSPVDTIPLGAPAGFIAVDDVDNTLLVTLPGRHALVVVDLTSRAILGTVDVGCDPRFIDSTGARH